MRVAARASTVASLIAVATLLTAGAARAQAPRVLLADVPCLAKGANTVVSAVAGPLPAGAQVRVYFRRQGFGDFYWTAAHPTSSGSYWAVLPLPEPDNDRTELYASTVSANGTPLAQSQVKGAPVDATCRTQLDNAQSAEASHLVIGETSLGQKGRKVAWFQCIGVRERIDVKGERRNDDACAPEPLFWERPEVLAPLAVIGGGGVTTVVIGGEPPHEISPANPPQ